MCHVIEHFGKTKFVMLNFFTGDQFCVGVKRFSIINDEINPLHRVSDKYEWTKTSYGLRCKLSKNTQPLGFNLKAMKLYQNSIGEFSEISIEDKKIEVMNSVLAGYHISPILTSNSYSIFVPSDDGRMIQIPVLFEEKDILFFDGRDVSVSRFTIPSVVIFIELIEAIDVATNQFHKHSVDINFYEKLCERSYQNCKFNDFTKLGSLKDERSQFI